jgi:hypothetical protein
MKATPNTTPNVTQLGYNASVAIVVPGKIHTITYSSLTPTKGLVKRLDTVNEPTRPPSDWKRK